MGARGHGFSLLELMLVVAIIMTLIAISVPHLRSSKMTANEAVARESLHTLHSALFQYWTFYRTYPTALANLGSGGEVGPTSAELIDPALASGQKSGYTFVYLPTHSDADTTVSGYTITATPNVAGLTGRLSFSMDQTGSVQILNSPPIAATPIASGVTHAPQE